LDARMPHSTVAKVLIRIGRSGVRQEKGCRWNYVRLMQMLLPQRLYHAIATHDPHDSRKPSFAAARQISKMISISDDLGSEQRLQRQPFVKEGYRIPDLHPTTARLFPYYAPWQSVSNLVFFSENFRPLWQEALRSGRQLYMRAVSGFHLTAEWPM